ncbi:hypothetical protein ND748_08600 [Frankia sp. AiPs1]|uniref:hypothetical protein n=1 Tax=Frankia sp. AiPs1 TaxID=573493 RepID=UPI0020446268|nr:hypothetical protein [Frankia sp. AiPs1]MCM3921722.1 hypothetical protein [Frankia sp. AiPs1]
MVNTAVGPAAICNIHMDIGYNFITLIVSALASDDALEIHHDAREAHGRMQGPGFPVEGTG